jgi:hypothetical protein
MPHFLVSIHHRDDYDAALLEDAAMHRAIDLLNEEMIAAGIRVYVGGLHDADTARSIRPQPDGTTQVTPGSYLPTNEHIGGLWVLEATHMEEALVWGRKAAIACRVPVEVREFHDLPVE